ncbi:MAG: hypothetical protein RL594_1221 [Bacteroidota bacterium]|jgi:ABC-type multidrug transport system ATPase subunit
MSRHRPNFVSMRLELVDVAYRSKESPIIAQATITLESPAVVVVTGGTASGKSVLHALLTGELTPTSGSIVVNGTDLSGLPLRKRRVLLGPLSTVRTDVFHDELNLFENLLLAAGSRGLPKEQATAAVLEGLADVGLSHRRLAPIHHLSTGERVQAGIARALLGSVEMLVIDDVFAGMDESSFRILLDYLTSTILRREIGMVLLTTDDTLAQLLPGSQRYVLRDGVLSQHLEVI